MIDALILQLRREASIDLTLSVRPQARGNRIKGWLSNGTLKVEIAAAPEDGAANQVLRRFLADTFDIPLSHVEILSGHTNRVKRIRLTRLRSE